MTTPQSTMNQLLLIVTIAGYRATMRAADVHSVIELEALTPVPRTAPHVAGLTALRSRVLTVIDCRRSLELAEDHARPMRQAAVVEHEGHFYALAVDGIEDVVEAHSEPMPLNVDLGKGWVRVTLGSVETVEGPMLLIDAARIIAGPEEALAA